MEIHPCDVRQLPLGHSAVAEPESVFSLARSGAQFLRGSNRAFQHHSSRVQREKPSLWDVFIGFGEVPQALDGGFNTPFAQSWIEFQLKTGT